VQDNLPDVIMTSCLSQFSAAVVRQYAARGLSSPPMVHMSAFYNDNIFATLAAGEAEGMMGTTHAVWDRTPEGEAIRTQYETRFGRTIANTTFTSSKTYDAMMLVALGHFAAAAANGVSVFDVSGEQVRDAIATLNDPVGVAVGPTAEGLATALDALAAGEAINYQGASAALDFDANRRIRTRVDVFRVAGNGFDIESDYFYDCTNPTCPRVE
jgi:branched-chain amino acid transport system substrate-binding protein